MAPSDRQQPEGAEPSPQPSPAPGPDRATPADASGSPAPARVGGREAFVRTPAPRRTQPAVNVSDEDFSADDYAESTSYTTKSRRPLSGAGYRRSRNQAERLKRDLRYGQYLEVPKGQRDIFSGQRRQRSLGIAALVTLIVLAAIIFLVITFWPA